MRRLLPLVLLIAACGGNDPDNRREIEKPERTHGTVPLSAIDQALRVEATTAASAIYKRVNMAGFNERNAGRDSAAFYASLNGTLTADKLAKIGVTERELTGQYYIPSDYTLSITGNQLVITASKAGTRGYTSETFILR